MDGRSSFKIQGVLMFTSVVFQNGFGVIWNET